MSRRGCIAAIVVAIAVALWLADYQPRRWFAPSDHRLRLDIRIKLEHAT